MASGILRALVWLLAAACAVTSAPAAAAGKHRKSASHASARAKKAKKSKANSHAAEQKAAPIPTAPTATPAPTAARAAPAVVDLPVAATPAAAVALPRAVTRTEAAPAKPVATKPPKSAKASRAAPAVALPAHATATAAQPLPLTATPTAALTDTPTTLPAAATPVAAHGLPAAATATAAPPPKPKYPTPVATAWALPQVPQSKLKSDVQFESIRKLVAAQKFDEALTAVDALLEKSPNDDELWVQRARLLYWLNRRAAARETLAPVQARHPEDAEIRELDAGMRLADGDIVGALAQYRALEIAGDGRPELHQRIIDLSLELDESDAVTKALRFGGHLSEEQEMAYTRMIHPWFVDVAGTTTFHSSTTWWRGDAHIGRRLNKRFNVLLGGIVEQRGSGADLERAAAGKGELYFGFSRVDGMIHVEASPNKSILPQIDVRGDLGVSIIKELSVGLYGRYAHYATLPTSQTFATTAWTLAPNLMFYVKEWTLQPGYMLINLQPSLTSASPYYHTGFIKARWEPTPRWSAFAWLYIGTDPTFVERFGIHTALGTSLVLGGEHWWTPRWGTRLSASRVQPFDSKNDPFTDITLVLRGRL